MTLHLKKAELHCHIEGAAPPALALAQAEKYGVDVSGLIEDGSYVWTDFSEFIVCYDRVASLFRTEEDYATLAETYLTELSAAGTIYSEIIVSPDHGNTIGIGADAYLRGLAAGIEAARAKTGIEGRMIITIIRHLGREAAERTALYAARRDHPLVTGFNLAGEERIYRVADFARAYDIARDAGLGLTIHAGEMAGADSVRDALDIVRPRASAMACAPSRMPISSGGSRRKASCWRPPPDPTSRSASSPAFMPTLCGRCGMPDAASR
ncbi:adenosine deaminase [Rhizobium sp. PP-F2F-G38]|nr:adenosine deaminase [Rhizobium sp. PP-F2F-G38]